MPVPLTGCASVRLGRRPAGARRRPNLCDAPRAVLFSLAHAVVRLLLEAFGHPRSSECRGFGPRSWPFATSCAFSSDRSADPGGTLPITFSSPPSVGRSPRRPNSFAERFGTARRELSRPPVDLRPEATGDGLEELIEHYHEARPTKGSGNASPTNRPTCRPPRGAGWSAVIAWVACSTSA
jgi:hypothetical protein